MTSVLFSSIFNPERVRKNKDFNPERNLEGFACGDSERPKDFPTFPDEQVGRSQVKTGAKQPMPHKLELTKKDKKALSKLTSSMYGFHGDSNDFWVHTRKPTQGQIPNLTMGDGRITDDITRHEFVEKLIDDKTKAFQIAGVDRLGGNKLITFVKNDEADTITLYTCDSKECYPVALEGEGNVSAFASAISGNLVEIQGVTVWKE